MTHLPKHLISILLLAVWLLSGCAGTRESLDSTWRTIDPAGHHRYHRDKYYPHERKIGIRLPGDAGR
jgi:hypothetical protein